MNCAAGMICSTVSAIGRLLLLLLCLPNLSFAWSGQVMNVYDGATITVAPLGDEKCPIFVTLYGIDAPNLQQDGGKEAQQWLSKKMPERTNVEIIPMGIDNSGRVVGLVGVKSRIINGELVLNGHAWVNTRLCRAMICRNWLNEQKKAKDEGKGVWQKKDEASWIPNAKQSIGNNTLPLLEGGRMEVPKDGARGTSNQAKNWLPMDGF